MTNKLEKADPLIGEKLGDYIIQALIGRGGMARVYEGFDEKLGRRAAVKVMEVQHDEGDELTQRFVREARAAANLEHAHIVNVYQFGESDNLYYMAMKYIEGKTLLNVLKRLRQIKQHLEPDQVVSIITQIGAALDYAHANGVIHRDIKPSNIMLTDDNRAILTDFGLTMRVGSETTLGTAFGTPRYIAPEQAIASHKSVPQSDIYSLGVVLYEMVTGQPPFDGDSPMTLALSHITNYPPPPISIRPDIPHPVQTVILKALEKRPENRWATATEMATALRDAYRGKEPDVQLSDEVIETPSAIREVLEPMSPDREDLKSTDPGSTASAPRPAGPVAASLPVPVQHDIIERKNSSVPETAKPAQLVPAVQKRSGVSAPVRIISRVFLILVVLGLLGIGGLLLANANTTDLSASQIFTFPTQPPGLDVRVIFTKDSFVVYNPNRQPISLENFSFVRDDPSAVPYEASKFGDRTHRNLGQGQCIQIRLRTADPDTLPSTCGSQTKVLIYDPAIVFWAPRNDADIHTSFLVKRNNTVVKTCPMQVNTCEFTVPE